MISTVPKCFGKIERKKALDLGGLLRSRIVGIREQIVERFEMTGGRK